MSGLVVAGWSGRQYLIVRRDGWWVVLDQETRECLSGGFKSPTDARAEVRRLDDTNGGSDNA